MIDYRAMNFLESRPWLAPMLCLACVSTQHQDPQLWRPAPGTQPDSIPGPVVDFGPYDDFSDALEAACPLILSKPNASVGHLQGGDRQLALRVSTEYCAWLYYTPEHKYELSMLTDTPVPGSSFRGETRCLLPPDVDDARYPPSSIKYIFILHNHPFATGISSGDIRFAAAMTNAHALLADVGNRKIPLSVIAFFANTEREASSRCGGFYQYIPATRELLKWVHAQGDWNGVRLGRVEWTSDTRFDVIEER